MSRAMSVIRKLRSRITKLIESRDVYFDDVYENYRSSWAKQIVQDLDKFVVLDPTKDPDPYELHGLSLEHRMSVMTVRLEEKDVLL